MSNLFRLAFLGVLSLSIQSAWADGVAAPTEPTLMGVDKISAGDTAWMLTSTALVLMMSIPGLALFYGGMVRKKNVPHSAQRRRRDRHLWICGEFRDFENYR